MSDILIKGMDMPTSCWDCEVGGAKQMDNATCPFYSMEFWEQENYQGKISDGCPLVPVPPHGRLIDADAFLALINDSTILSDFIKCIINPLIRGEPTVIEAEED